MTGLLHVDGLHLARNIGLTFTVHPGDLWAVMGLAGSGKTALLDQLCSVRTDPSIKLRGEIVRDGVEGISRLSTPLSIARRAAGRKATPRVAEALLATGLSAVSKASLSHLSPSQVAAAQLLAPLAAPAELCLIDGSLDRVDPRVRRSVMQLLESQCSQGRAGLIATHSTEVARACGKLLILRQGKPPFVGTIDHLARRSKTREIIVESDDNTAARALADPLALEIREIDGGLAIRTKEGQALAAKLLTQGYGAVRAVITPLPDLDALLNEELSR